MRVFSPAVGGVSPGGAKPVSLFTPSPGRSSDRLACVRPGLLPVGQPGRPRLDATDRATSTAHEPGNELAAGTPPISIPQALPQTEDGGTEREDGPNIVINYTEFPTHERPRGLDSRGGP